MKAFFAAVIGKSGYEKWKVNEPGVFYFLFYVQSREIPKKPVAGVARKESSHETPDVAFHYATLHQCHETAFPNMM